MMGFAEIERHCLSLPGVTLSVQWGEDRVFKLGGKMFAMIGVIDGRPRNLSFKTGDDSFEILTRLSHIIPAPYLARMHWVMLETAGALPARDLKAYLTRAHALIAAKLTRKARAALGLEG